MKIRFLLSITLSVLLMSCLTQATGAKDLWRISLKGVRTDVLGSTCFDYARKHEGYYVTLKLEKKRTIKTYKGMPLYLIAAMVDGTDAQYPYVFDRSLWEGGYEITITARDGYSATFNTKDIPYRALVLADSEDGKSIAPSIVGDVPGNLWIKEVVEIELDLGISETAEEPFKLIMDINGKISSFSLEELESSPYYIENKGSFTTSAGTTYSGYYGGVKFAQFLSQFMHLRPDNTVTIVAMDGYEMTHSGKDILDESDGVWILAFKLDNEYLPQDPGYIRTIKVGPDNPNIDGHLSVKMIEKIVVKDENYRDFALTIHGRMTFTLDRQTLQSGINCHKKTVHFERKGSSALYTGIPLWRLLAFSDDPKYAPHKQDKSIISYQKETAQRGYRIEISASDGFTISLDSRELDGNDEVILAMYKENEELPDREWPLILVWGREASPIPDGIKPVRQIESIRLIFGR